jgi:hypothetical protein
VPAQSKLFKPLKVGKMELKHRIVFPPLTWNRNDDSHVPLPFMAKYYADRASAPGTLVIYWKQLRSLILKKGRIIPLDLSVTARLRRGKTSSTQSMPKVPTITSRYGEWIWLLTPSSWLRKDWNIGPAVL